MKHYAKRVLAILLAALMLFSLAACGKNGKPNPERAEAAPVEELEQPQTVTEIETAAGLTFKVEEPICAETYDTVYAAFETVRANAENLASIEQFNQQEELVINTEAEEFGEPDYTAALPANDAIAHGDTIIRQGEYIYMVSGSELVIVHAAGGETKEVGRTFVIAAPPEGYSGSETANAVFVSGNNLYVSTYECLFRTVEDEGGLIYESSEKAHLKRYDISDPANPVIVGDFAQSGQYLDSVFVNGRIYLISACGIWAPIPEDESTFVPVITRNGEDQILAAEDITICPGLDSTDYTVVTVINADSGEDLKTHALTGYHAWSAIDGERLYLARTAYDYTVSDAHKEDQYSVTDHAYNAFTRIAALKLDDTLALESSTAVEGALYGEGAFAAADGEIYLAVKEDGYTYQTYTDEKYGFVNILMQEERRGNALYALSADLELERGLRDIADAVYTVYFAGKQACVLGYDTLTPAFVIDMAASELSAKTGPASIRRNLYRFGDGLAAGVGPVYDGSGVISGLGLAMYDTSAADLSELSAISAGQSWSNALGMTGAVQILPEQQLIAIPTDTGFAMFAWDGSAWMQSGAVELGYITPQTRVFIADGTAYFCNDAMVLAVSASDWSEIARVEFAYG